MHRVLANCFHRSSMRYTAFSPCNAPQRSCTGSRRQPAAEQQQQLARCLPTCSSQQQPKPQPQQQQQHQLSRRAALALPVGLMALVQSRQAQAFSPPPPGERRRPPACCWGPASYTGAPAPTPLLWFRCFRVPLPRG